MRRAPLILVLCGAVGLGVVGFAASGHLQAARRSLERGAVRDVRQTLLTRGQEAAQRLDLALKGAPVALYDAKSQLVRPAPPASVRSFEVPTETLAAFYLDRDASKALEHATTSAERAAALLRMAHKAKDPALLERALGEPALAGTELALLARRRLATWTMTPDPAWRDDVSALLGGPSDAFARALLRRAEVEPGASREERARLQRVTPRTAVFVHDGLLCRGAVAEDGWEVRHLSLAAFDGGAGAIRETLPAPFDMLEVRGDTDPAALAAAWRKETRSLLLMYGLAAAMILLGTGYALAALRRARRLTVAKQDFLANVTHELKTPLANVRLYTESLLSDRVAPEDHKEFLSTILEESGRLDGLVEGLLHLAHGPKLAPAPVDCRQLLEETGARWRPRLERAGFTLDVVAPDLPPVRGDEEALGRALSNLLDNARKYAANDPRVTLSGTANNGSVRLTVRDHGPGIPTGARDAVLRPFTRLEAADRKATEGAGLGLSLVVACMDAHGGRVEIESGEPGGAAVTLVLPVESA